MRTDVKKYFGFFFCFVFLLIRLKKMTVVLGQVAEKQQGTRSSEESLLRSRGCPKLDGKHVRQGTYIFLKAVFKKRNCFLLLVNM